MRSMRQMNSMMSSMFADPFAGMFAPMPGASPFDGGLMGQSALTGGPLGGAMMQQQQALMQHGHHHHQQQQLQQLQQQPRHHHHQHQQQHLQHLQQQQQHHQQQHMMPFGGIGAFGPAGGMANFNRLMMADLSSGGGSSSLMVGGSGGGVGTSFSSSQVVTMSRGPDGRPQVYKATSSTKTGPGGVRETQKTVQDSRSGVKKMAIGHHIGERSHVVERERNYRTGEEEERQDFINLDEDDADEFNREYAQRSRSLTGPGMPGGSGRNGAPNVAAIMPSPNVAAAPLAIMSSPSTSQSPVR